MAEVRCPMCGKSNPAEADICQFCEARLRPIWETGPLKDAAANQEQGKSSDPADWLRALGGDAEQPSENQEPESDWLGGLRAETTTPEQEDAPIRPLDDLPGDGPDWLSRLGLASGAPDPETQGAGISDDTSSWASFSDNEILPEPDWLKAEPQLGGQHNIQDDDLPDWLKSPADSEPAPEPDVQKTFNEELPDWLLSDATGVEPSAAFVEEETPFPGADFSDAELPDTELPGAEITGQQPQDIGEPFIFGLSEETLPSTVDEPIAENVELLPEWLTASSESEPPGDLPPILEDDASDQIFPQALEPSEEETIASVVGLGSEPLAELPELQHESGAGIDDEEDFAAWMATVGAATDQPEASEQDASDALDWMGGAGGAPEWLQKFAGEQPGAEQPPVERPDWLPSGEDAGAEIFTPDSDTSEWIASVGSEADRLQSVAEGSPEEGEGDDLSWLDALETSYPGMTLETGEPAEGFASEDDVFSTEGADLAAPGELPGWLSGEAQAQITEQADEEDVNPGELPSWLLGMRPEGVMPVEQAGAVETSFEQAEGAGPLAGLRGALPAEPDIAQVEKPPTYSVLLQVTEAQNTQTKMLTDLVAGETEAIPAAGPPLVGSLSMFRWVATILLILALLLSIITGLPVIYRPAPPAELTAVLQIVEGLQSGAPVLVAVDYEPGYSAEMDAVTRAALTHLLRRNAVPTLISTVPTGPMQIERLIAQVSKVENRAFSPGEQYINLGYFPGGSMALASFASASESSAVATLQDLGDLSSYRLIMVATADPDRARSWIEQAGARLGDTPLVLLLSAQAEPMVRPYYDSNPRQVQGMLTGLTGALMYETNTSQQGGASRNWASFNVGLAIAVTLMLLGAAFNILSVRLARRKLASEVKD